MKFSTKLREHMKRLDLKQPSLADKLGVHQTLVSAWLLGKRRPQLAQIRILADLFGVTCEYLADDDRDVMDADEVEYEREVRRIIRKIGSKQVWEILVDRIPEPRPAARVEGPIGGNPIINTMPDDGRRVVRPGPAPPPPPSPSVHRRRKPGGESA